MRDLVPIAHEPLADTDLRDGGHERSPLSFTPRFRPAGRHRRMRGQLVPAALARSIAFALSARAEPPSQDGGDG